MAGNVQVLTEQNFDQVIASTDTLVLVDFWAEWCGPCKRVAPILEEIASENAGKITIAKVNIDENQNLATRFSIMSIPTLMLFKNGEPARPPIVGAKPKSELLNDISPYMG